MCLLGMWTTALGRGVSTVGNPSPGPSPLQSRVREPETSFRGPGMWLQLQHLTHSLLRRGSNTQDIRKRCWLRLSQPPHLSQVSAPGVQHSQAVGLWATCDHTAPLLRPGL